MMGAALVWLVLGLAAGLIGYAVGRNATPRAGIDPAELEVARLEAQRLRALVYGIKDLAWDNRELDPALSTIIIDEIRTYEKRELE